MSDSVFDNDQLSTATDGKSNLPSVGDTPSFKMIGDGKRYKDFQAADKALDDQLQFIETLKREKQDALSQKDIELEALRVELAKRDAFMSASDVLNQQPRKSETTDNSSSPVNLSPEAMQKVAEQVYENKLRSSQHEKNVELVDNKLKEIYGTRAKEIVQSKAKALGIDFKELSKTSPQAALELLIDKGEKPTYEFKGSMSNSYKPVDSIVPSPHALGSGVFDFSADQTYQDLVKRKDVKGKFAYVEAKLREKGAL